MKKIDFERAAVLLDIMAKVANVGTMFTNISGEAGEELKGIQADCQSNARERADKIRSEEQVAQQKALQAAAEVSNERQPNPNPPNTPPTGPGQPTIIPANRPTPEDKDADGIADIQEDETIGIRHPRPTPPLVDRRL